MKANTSWSIAKRRNFLELGCIGTSRYASAKSMLTAKSPGDIDYLSAFVVSIRNFGACMYAFRPLKSMTGLHLPSSLGTTKILE